MIESPKLSSDGCKSPMFSFKPTLSTKADFFDKGDDSIAYHLSDPGSNSNTAEESKSIESPNPNLKEMEQ